MLSNAAGWSIFSAVFFLVKPCRASLSSIHRQSRTLTWLRYDESRQDTSRTKKYDREDFIKRHLARNWTPNPAELICKTIEHVIRTLRHNGPRCEKSVHSARTTSNPNDLCCLTALQNKRHVGRKKQATWEIRGPSSENKRAGSRE